MPPVRREIHFQGRVQGVGFRQTTRSIAADFRVVGFVQNLFDGRVLLVAEGEPDELNRFVAELVAEMDRYVQNHQSLERPAVGEFTEFSVRY